MTKSLKSKLIFLMAVSLNLFSCDPFPTKEIYISDTQAKTCAEVKILKESPLEFGNASFVPIENCAVIYGFKQSKVGEVTAWIRRTQDNYKKNGGSQ
jgi:hypothetical protein